MLLQRGPSPLDHEFAELRNEHMTLQNEVLRRQLVDERPNRPTTLHELTKDRADYVILGPRGSGKSTTGRALAAAYRDRGYTIVPYLYGEGAVKSLANVPMRSVLLADETAIGFRLFAGKAAPPDLKEALAMARHRELPFIFVAQHTSQVHPEILRFEYRLGVKNISNRQLRMARPELIPDLERARRDLTFLPKSKATTWWSLEDEETTWTANGPGPW